MSVKLADVERIIAAFPGITTTTKWGNHTWQADERGFAWRRPLSKADLARLVDSGREPPVGDLLAVNVDSLDAKDALLAMDLPGFFTIEHFKAYPAVLIELRRARIRDVRAVLTDAIRMARARKLPARRPRRQRTKGSAR